MNLHTHNLFGLRHVRRSEAVALVITLLMLSVITFLTIAFLAMSQRNKTAVSTSLDLANARAASDAASARAQAEIIAQMLAHGDALYYDWMVSSAFTSPSNFNRGEGYDPNNVNYDSFLTSPGTYSSADYAQLMANLWYDPRPPVFVVTNQAYPTNYDARHYIDINRNGRFETNGYQLTNDNFGKSYAYGYAFENGEPQWIGILRNPLYPHSSTNLFLSRYAYLVLPIGKELDFNYIHNYLKATYANIPGNLDNTSVLGNENDAFARDQGIGSWELNLAGTLDAVSPWAYESSSGIYPGYVSNGYNYVPPNGALNNSGLVNTGNAFDDAEAILHFRYPPSTPYLATLAQNFPSNYSNFQ